EAGEKYEHREKYTGGAGYYLGESKYSGWVVKKEKYYRDRESIIDAYALVAGDEANICVKVQEATNTTPETVTGDFVIVNYSEKALAVFGDTRPVKDQLKALGGRFNPKLTHEGGKQAGWIFSKSKEQKIRNLLAIRQIRH
ncbi:MAG: fusion protein, partial [Prevotellaceae bacterium]|nr:fusion protein [Prevotellaceae bacterium]